jgi:sarcosine oxidase subunit delta
MSFLIACPNAGPCEATDFWFGGEVKARPVEEPSLRELCIYNHFAANLAGVQRERWFHSLGCRAWLLAQRNTATNEI